MMPTVVDTRTERRRERFDRSRQTLGLWLGPVAFLGVLVSPAGLEPSAHRLAAVFALVVVFWVTEAIPLPATALLGPALAVVLENTDRGAVEAAVEGLGGEAIYTELQGASLAKLDELTEDDEVTAEAEEAFDEIDTG